MSIDCLPVHELNNQRLSVLGDEEPQALSACYLYKEVDASRRVEGRPLIPMLAGFLIDVEK